MNMDHATTMLEKLRRGAEIERSTTGRGFLLAMWMDDDEAAEVAEILDLADRFADRS